MRLMKLEGPRFGWRAVAPTLLLAVAACSSSGTASIDVVVKDVSMSLVAEASVTTTPTTESLSTGEDGHARFTGLSAGTYTVSAKAPTAGVATATVSLQAGESRTVTMTLRRIDTTGSSDGGTDGGNDAGNDGGDPSDGPDAGGDAATMPSPIVLQDLTKDSNGIDLRWVSSAAFTSYRVYRAQDSSGGFSIINIINDASATAYRDETVTLGVAYRYRVAGLSSTGSEVSSNIQSISAGMFVSVNSQVERMKVDPQRPYLYAIDRVNNSLHFVNLTTQAVEKTIFIGSAPTGLDINAGGTELYVANSGSTEIAVVDLTARAKSRSLLVDTTTYPSGNPYRIVATTGDTLVFAAQDSYSSLKLTNAVTGASLASVTSSNGGAMVASPDGTHVYTAGYYLTRYDIVGATMKQVDTTSDFGSSTTTISRSGNGTYLFYGAKKVLATNLKSTLGTFPEIIQLANSTGTRAVGVNRVYDGDTYLAKATLPLATTVMAISPDDKTLYLYDTITSRIYLWKMP
jgi:hypothetical protein